MLLEVDRNIFLRQLEKSDTIDIFNTIVSQREYLGKWLPFVEFTNKITDTESFVDSVINTPEDKFEIVFTIREQDTFIGLIGFKGTDNINKKTEIGYWLSEKYQKKGIMTKSVKKLCDFAFHEKGMNRIQIKCAVDNEPSKEIPKRLGFKYEGIERDGELLSGNVFTDLEVYSKLKSDL